MRDSYSLCRFQGHFPFTVMVPKAVFFVVRMRAAQTQLEWLPCSREGQKRMSVAVHQLFVGLALTLWVLLNICRGTKTKKVFASGQRLMPSPGVYKRPGVHDFLFFVSSSPPVRLSVLFWFSYLPFPCPPLLPFVSSPLRRNPPPPHSQISQHPPSLQPK